MNGIIDATGITGAIGIIAATISTAETTPSIRLPSTMVIVTAFSPAKEMRRGDRTITRSGLTSIVMATATMAVIATTDATVVAINTSKRTGMASCAATIKVFVNSREIIGETETEMETTAVGPGKR